MRKARYLALISVVFPLVGSVVMMAVGVIKTMKSVQILFFGGTLSDPDVLPAGLDYLDQTMVAVVESVDAFLISLAMIIFGVGVYTLFVGKLDLASGVLRVDSLEHLKKMLTEVILVVLAVLFLRGLLLFEDLPWRLLIVPMAAALFALAIRVVGWSSDRQSDVDRARGGA